MTSLPQPHQNGGMSARAVAATWPERAANTPARQASAAIPTSSQNLSGRAQDVHECLSEHEGTTTTQEWKANADGHQHQRATKVATPGQGPTLEKHGCPLRQTQMWTFQDHN